jgi:hypothetical protein
MSLDFDNMDTTDHGHIPYVIILIRAMQDWKNAVRMAIFYTAHYILFTLIM